MYASLTKRNLLDGFAVLWIILSTGSLFFCIFHMELAMFVLVGIAMCYLILNWSTRRAQSIAALTILIFVGVNFALNPGTAVINKDLIILMMRLFSVMIIFSNISKTRFLTLYCRIMYWLTCLSLVCFAITMLGFDLPGETTIWYKEKYYFYTFYHTVGRWYKFHRNAGVFWEAPAFSIFLNIAIMFLLIGKNEIPRKQKVRYVVVYVAGVLSTVSSLSWLAFGLVVIALLLNDGKSAVTKKDQGRSTRRYIVALAILLLIALVIIEAVTGIMSYKLIGHNGSYGTRSNDTLMALRLAWQSPVTGYGIFNSYTGSRLMDLKVTDNSNWFASIFMYFGIPMACMYLGYFGYRLKKLFNCNWACWMFVFMAFIVFMNTELIGTMTLFICFLFPLSDTEEDDMEVQQDTPENLDNVLTIEDQIKNQIKARVEKRGRK